jgi:hypothetical protein
MVMSTDIRYALNLKQIYLGKPQANLLGYSIALTNACVTISTAYNSYYVKNFTARIINYMRFNFTLAFPSLLQSKFNKIVFQYGIYVVTETETENLDILNVLVDDET